MKFKDKIKKHFTEKPKGDFWMWAFITIVIFRYISPLMIIFLVFFNIGLVAPDIENNSQIFQNASDKLTESFITTFQKVYDAGANIGMEHPLIAKILFFGLSHIVWVFYGLFILLIWNLIRYGISWVIRKKINKRPKKRKKR